jgi:hypothetical protein
MPTISQPVRIVGRLDMICQSRRSFRLILDDGTEVCGQLVRGELSNIKDLFTQRVVIHGRAVYRPDGRLLRLDGELIEAGANESAFWSRVPRANGRKLDPNEILQPQTPTSGIANIIGKWPGDETEAELLEALKRMG